MQFIAEALVLAAVGALLGVGLAQIGIGWFNRALAATDVPFWIDVALHPPVLFFAIGVTMLAAVVSGILPALQASRLDVSEILKDESRGSSGMRIGKLTRSLVVAEIALSCGLLVGAGLMIKSVTKLRNVDFGFDGNRVFTARVGLPEPDYPNTLKQIRFWEQLEERVAAIPGVEAVSITQSLPALGAQTPNFAIEGATYTEDRDYPYALQVIASPGYFATFDIPVRQGRLLLPQDRQGTMQVAVVNESFVAKYFANADPVGRRIRFGASQSTAPWTTIVGVVPDRFPQFIDDDETAAIYVPIQQHWARFMYVSARARSNAPALAMPIRDAVVSLDPDLPIYWPRTHTQAVAEETWFYRVFGTLFMVFGAVALFLAAIGLYAVMAFSVGQRTREVGVRMALGAQRGDVIGLVLRQGVVQMAVGMTVGLAFAAGVSQLLQVILFKVEPRDPIIFAGVFLVLGGAAALACLLPARKATRIDPIIALRAD
jgi:predicted permease